MASQSSTEETVNIQQLFGELRALLSVPQHEMDISGLYECVDTLTEIEPKREGEFHLYFHDSLSKKMGVHMFESRRIKAVYDWAKDNATTSFGKDTLTRLATGGSFAGSGGRAPSHIRVGSGNLSLPVCLMWIPSPIHQSIWTLCEAHCNAIWAALDDYERGLNTSD